MNETTKTLLISERLFIEMVKLHAKLYDFYFIAFEAKYNS